ncbi:hypothetical protein ACJ72_03174 [Emergomyces africanus]|uniref:Uncharacterized protein n=1 Tax=Emergomyces africanus TaxID=1955775 RepID=A0A1B7P0D8_9EURO|nr:hypothetical protein ACJ72_03174 [Emergomyces africanus]
MSPTARNRLKTAKATAPEDMWTVPRALGILKNTRPLQDGCLIMFSGAVEGRGQGRDYWRKRLGWKGEKSRSASCALTNTSRSTYHRYVAVGNPEQSDDNSGIRYRWDGETGQWVENMREAKSKVQGSDKTRSRKVVTFQLEPDNSGQTSEKEKGKADPRASTEGKGWGADSPLVGSSAQRRRKGVGLGISPVPKQGQMDAEVGPATHWKRALDTSTTPLPELTPGANQVPRAERMTGESGRKRRREAQASTTVKGNIAVESDQDKTNPPSKTGGRPGSVALVEDDSDGLSLGCNPAHFSPREEVRMSGRGLKSRVTGRTALERLAHVADIVPKPRENSPTNMDEKSKIQTLATSTTITTTKKGEGVALRSNVASKPKEQSKKTPASRCRSRKVVPETASVGMTAGSVFNYKASGIDARQTQGRAVAEVEKLEPAGRGKKKEKSSIQTHSETTAETEGRPKRLRRAPQCTGTNRWPNGRPRNYRCGNDE